MPKQEDEEEKKLNDAVINERTTTAIHLFECSHHPPHATSMNEQKRTQEIADSMTRIRRTQVEPIN